jgi:hypothetical protein
VLHAAIAERRFANSREDMSVAFHASVLQPQPSTTTLSAVSCTAPGSSRQGDCKVVFSSAFRRPFPPDGGTTNDGQPTLPFSNPSSQGDKRATGGRLRPSRMAAVIARGRPFVKWVAPYNQIIIAI